MQSITTPWKEETQVNIVPTNNLAHILTEKSLLQTVNT